jgi:hypothetical protein
MNKTQSTNMQSVRITITRALAELKLLDARIAKATDEHQFIALKTKIVNSNIDNNSFLTQSAASLQSVFDLINRRERIKTAIMYSNHTTMVKIGNKDYTVAEAIELKNSINYKQRLLEVLRELEVLRDQRERTNREYEKHKTIVKQSIDNNITQICSRDVKPDAKTIQDLTDMMWKNDPIEILDGIGIDKVINDLNNDIDEFMLNVDFVLSESNSTTFINV